LITPFFKNIFYQNKKRAEIPDKQGVFGSKKFFCDFLFFLKIEAKTGIIP
jgi:hypothetical protein